MFLKYVPFYLTGGPAKRSRIVQRVVLRESKFSSKIN